MNKPTLFFVSCLFGVVSTLIVVGLYSINRSIQAPLEGTYVRDGGNVCLKQLRVIYLVSTDNAKPDGAQPNSVPIQKLCAMPHQTQIRLRNLQMKGDTYDVKCTAPGYAVSEKPIEVFYWDRGQYGESLATRSTAAPGDFIATPHCDRYGIQPIR
jgi:hypothetical protein